MTNIQNHLEEILSRSISGFHQYCLNDPVHLFYVSRNLCEMTGYVEEELLHEAEDRYAAHIHPSDQDRYTAFLQLLSQKEQTKSCEYRLQKKDGSFLLVRDTAVSRKNADGQMIADSVLTDITDLKRETQNLQFLNETIPCGFLRYTCEKEPKITYMNQKMKEIFRFHEAKEGEPDDLSLYQNNIFLMIPMEERRRFALYLNRVYAADAPIAGEITLLRCDGSRAYVFGWVTKIVHEDGTEEFQSVCMDITERHHKKKAAETQRYLKALTDVYDKIFEFNLDTNTVKCLHSNDGSRFKYFEDIAMQMDEVFGKWIKNSVLLQDLEKVENFFEKFFQKKLYETGAGPAQISYRAKSSDGVYRQYKGVFIKVDESVSFYCCRKSPDVEEADVLRSENVQLKENMKELVMRFTDGLAAFEITAQGLVKPLYASENVCSFFGYTKEEWLLLMEHPTTIEKFIAYSESSFEEFAKLLRDGEAEFLYFDHRTQKKRPIRAVCSQKEQNSASSRYVMLYSMEENRSGEMQTRSAQVSIRTFGYFDVFVGDQPIAFRNKKSKELFALLVDRRGGYVTSEEAIGFLWEDEPVNSVTLARYRKVALRLKNILEEYGIADVVESVDGKRRIVSEKVQCDLYDYLADREHNATLFHGSYLTNYSWGEVTLGELNTYLE